MIEYKHYYLVKENKNYPEHRFKVGDVVFSFIKPNFLLSNNCKINCWPVISDFYYNQIVKINDLKYLGANSDLEMIKLLYEKV